jgi:hypothetical protein
MGVDISIEFEFDKKDGDKLPKIFEWFDRNTKRLEEVEIKFRNGIKRKYNLRDSEWLSCKIPKKLNFSKKTPTFKDGEVFFPGISILLEPTEEIKNYFVKKISEPLSENDFNKMVRECNGRFPVGLFILTVYYNWFPWCSEKKEGLEVHLFAPTYDYGAVFMECESAKTLLLDFCEKLKPNKGYFSVDGETIHFWDKNLTKRWKRYSENCEKIDEFLIGPGVPKKLKSKKFLDMIRTDKEEIEKSKFPPGFFVVKVAQRISNKKFAFLNSFYPNIKNVLVWSNNLFNRLVGKELAFLIFFKSDHELLTNSKARRAKNTTLEITFDQPTDTTKIRRKKNYVYVLEKAGKDVIIAHYLDGKIRIELLNKFLKVSNGKVDFAIKLGKRNLAERISSNLIIRVLKATRSKKFRPLQSKKIKKC